MKKIIILYKILILFIILLYGCSTGTQSGGIDEDHDIEIISWEPSDCKGNSTTITVKVKAKSGPGNTVDVYSRAITEIYNVECNGNTAYPFYDPPIFNYWTLPTNQEKNIQIEIFTPRCNFPGYKYRLAVGVDDVNDEKIWKEVCEYNYTDANYTYPNCKYGNKLSHSIEYDFMEGYDIRYPSGEYDILIAAYDDANVNIHRESNTQNTSYILNGGGSEEATKQVLMNYYYSNHNWQIEYYFAGLNDISNNGIPDALGFTFLGSACPSFVLVGKCRQPPSGDRRAIVSTIHELGHQIAVNHHCDVPTCIMRSTLASLPTQFCNDHRCMLYYSLK